MSGATNGKVSWNRVENGYYHGHYIARAFGSEGGEIELIEKTGKDFSGQPEVMENQ
jgi:hypothetical protein